MIHEDEDGGKVIVSRLARGFDKMILITTIRAIPQDGYLDFCLILRDIEESDVCMHGETLTLSMVTYIRVFFFSCTANKGVYLRSQNHLLINFIT